MAAKGFARRCALAAPPTIVATKRTRRTMTEPNKVDYSCMGDPTQSTASRMILLVYFVYHVLFHPPLNVCLVVVMLLKELMMRVIAVDVIKIVPVIVVLMVNVYIEKLVLRAMNVTKKTRVMTVLLLVAMPQPGNAKEKKLVEMMRDRLLAMNVSVVVN